MDCNYNAVVKRDVVDDVDAVPSVLIVHFLHRELIATTDSQILKIEQVNQT